MNLLFLASLLPLTASQSLSDLYLENAPSSPRPYIIPHYANSHAVTIGSQLYRFTVTGPSSDYAFTLMSTNAPSSGSLGVLPHIHHVHYENFFNVKGRFQLWAQYGDEEQQTRLLTQGDYGSVPRNTTHTFQILDPDTEMVGVISPGGFEYVEKFQRTG
jgi:mannose-6-phosphate isomerase-like protein (cupin superfamily)